ncbi:hypothetical protein Tco_0575853 [Tanacetum coccineum]
MTSLDIFLRGRSVCTLDSLSLPTSVFLFLPVLSHIGIHISQLFVLEAARVSHFEISYRVYGRVPTVHLFWRFYLATNLHTGWITIEKRRKKKNTIVPTCYVDPFDSLKGWREKFFWVNASMAPVAMRWFSGKEFLRDSIVDGIDEDMVLETLLNDYPTRIRKYPKEFLILLRLSRMWYAPAARPLFYDDDGEEMRLQDFIKVPNPFYVVCAEKKLAENERLILEQTVDVVTLPSDHVVKLALVPLNQMIPAVALPPPANVKKMSLALALVEDFALKNGKSAGESSSDAVVAGDSASKADDVLSARLVGKGKRPSAPRKPLSKKAYLKGSFKTSVSLSSASTHSEPLVSAHPGPQPSPVSHHIPGIIFDPVEDSAETPREDRFYAFMSVDPSLAKDIYHLDWELTNDFIMDKGPLCRRFIDHLATPGQFSCLRSLSHLDVYVRANMDATRHITLFSKSRLRLEHAELSRSKLERRLARLDAALEKRDAEIARLQKLVNEKPSG